MNTVATTRPPVLLGCGILQREVHWLIQQQGWQINTDFLAPSLHNHLDRLAHELNYKLELHQQQGHQCLVFYGACHPQMEQILQQHHCCRTAAQNCLVMLLGYPRFMALLQQGAYFLLQDWAQNFEDTLIQSFGNHPAVIRQIFQDSHRFMLALRTPCSTDYTPEAEAAAAFVGLPLQWLDVELTQLQAVLQPLIDRYHVVQP